jgi:aminopeptidase N
MNKGRLIILFVLFFALDILSYAQQINFKNAKFSRERNADILHYAYRLSLNETERSVSGTATVTFTPLRSDFKVFELDQEGMNFTSATAQDGKPLRYFLEGKKIKIALEKPYKLNETTSVSIAYTAKPKRGLYFVSDSSAAGKTWQVWTQGQSEDNHCWIPCYDYPNDKATSEMFMTVKGTTTAVANGTLREEKKNADGSTTFHYVNNKPHSTYLISLVVGDFVKLSDTSNEIQLDYFVPNAQKGNTDFTFSKTPFIINYFSDKTGVAFPWETYTQVTVNNYLNIGMEYAGGAILHEKTLHDARTHLDYKSDGLIAHELSHQWFGNLVTMRDWSHSWLHEGFAAYFEALWLEHERGNDDMMWFVLGLQRRSISADNEEKRPIVWNGYTDADEIFDEHIYAKGGAVLNMLRKYLGDDLWWKAIQHYLRKHQFQNAETNDLKIAIEEATGINLQWFFNQWLYKSGFPEFVVEDTYDETKDVLKLTVRQTQKLDSLTGIFSLPVEIEFFTAAGSKVERIWIDRRTKEFSFSFEEKPLAIIFDKGSALIKQLEYERTTDELLYLLEHGDTPARLEALDILRRSLITDDSAKITEAIIHRLANDSFWGVRANAAEALAGVVHTSEAQMQLLSSLRDENSKVRISAIRSLEKIKGAQPLVILPSLQKSFSEDSSYSVVALALSALAKIDSANALSYCIQGLNKDSYQDQIRIAALKTLAKLNAANSVNTFMDYSMTGNSHTIRTEALQLLVRSFADTNALVKHLSQFLNDPVPQIRSTVVSLLENVPKEDVLRMLRKQRIHEYDNRILQLLEEVIQSLEEQLEKKIG